VTGADFSGVDIDLLADFIGGVLTGTPEESVVAARIADDPAWQAAYESLGEGMLFVSAELSRLGPEPMPADLAERLDATLAGFALLNAETTPETASQNTTAGAAQKNTESATASAAQAAIQAAAERASGSAVQNITTQNADAGTALNITTQYADGSGGQRAAAQAGAERAATGAAPAAAEDAGSGARLGEADAAAAVDPAPIAPELVEPGAPRLTLVRGGLAVDDGAPGVRKTQPEPRRGRRLRWAAPIAVAAGLIAFVGFGLDYLAGRQQDSVSTDSAAGSAAARSVAPNFAASGGEATLSSGTDYTHATLGVDPVQPLTAPLTAPGTPARKTTPEMASGVESALQRLTSPSALAECLAAIEQANGGGALSEKSVDYARFDGAPAVIVRFTARNGRWAWASGADCGTPPGDAATLDKVPVG
jgi:hypothetical protein